MSARERIGWGAIFGGVIGPLCGGAIAATVFFLYYGLKSGSWDWGTFALPLFAFMFCGIPGLLLGAFYGYWFPKLRGKRLREVAVGGLIGATALLPFNLLMMTERSHPAWGWLIYLIPATVSGMFCAVLLSNRLNRV